MWYSFPSLMSLAPVCLNRKGTPASTHWRRMSKTHSYRHGRASGPDSPPGHHLGDILPQPGGQVNRAQQGLAGDGFVPDRSGLQDGQAKPGPLLVFRRGANGHVFVPLPPVRRQAVPQAADTLGDEEEIEVGAHPHHRPGPGPPLVRVLQQKVRGKARPHHLPRRDHPASIPLLPEGQVVAFGPVHLGGVQPAAGISPIDVAVGAAGGGFAAPMPGVPVCHVSPAPRCTAAPRPAKG